jgi:hypothetical protein
MNRPMRRLALVLALVGPPVVACTGNGSTSPSTTPPAQVNDTFSGALNQNGALSFTFAVAAAGTLTATLTAVGSDSPPKIGLSLGTWNGSSCSVVIANDNATVGTAMQGQASAAGVLCVRLYDVGNIVTPVTVEVQVMHP